jgi:hypothetical protein
MAFASDQRLPSPMWGAGGRGVSALNPWAFSAEIAMDFSLGAVWYGA